MNVHRLVAWAVVSALVVVGCSDQPGPAAPDRITQFMLATVSDSDVGRHIVVFVTEQVPADFGVRVARLGGTVEASIDNIGVATVTGLTEAAAVELATEPDIRAVENDAMSMRDDDLDATDALNEDGANEDLAPADATASPTGAQFYARQWNLRAVFADAAWAAGHFGSRDVVVAILDTGIDYLHRDLEGLVDLARSTSFVPEDNSIIAERFPDRLPITDLRGHGTAAASIVGSNAKLLAGINRDVTLIAVKIWDRFGLGPFGRVLGGIVYAADQGADVISISGSYTFDKSENPGIMAAVERAVNYAYRHGAVLVSGAGNDAADLDHNADMARLPCQAAHVICASATGPPGAAPGVEGPWENVDARAPYSAFGRSAIDVAAPGGEIAPRQFRGVWLPCTTTLTETIAFPPCRTGAPVSQGRGASWAVAHVSGLAAQLVAQLGHGNPALIRSRILESADDLDQPGTDPYYGKGRINIGRALGMN